MGKSIAQKVFLLHDGDLLVISLPLLGILKMMKKKQ